jgi:hypothetical protein
MPLSVAQQLLSVLEAHNTRPESTVAETLLKGGKLDRYVLYTDSGISRYYAIALPRGYSWTSGKQADRPATSWESEKDAIIYANEVINWHKKVSTLREQSAREIGVYTEPLSQRRPCTEALGEADV